MADSAFLGLPHRHQRYWSWEFGIGGSFEMGALMTEEPARDRVLVVVRRTTVFGWPGSRSGPGRTSSRDAEEHQI